MSEEKKAIRLGTNRFSTTNQPANRGRKKGSRNFKTLFKHYLNQPYTTVDKNGEPITLTAMDAIVIKVIENAIKTGDPRLVEMIMTRVDGLPVQGIKQLGDQQLKITYEPVSKEELEEQDNFEAHVNPDDKPIEDNNSKISKDNAAN
jgi:hypothetical protein